MGKEGDLWDDSALVKAFNAAISKYKIMHGIGALNKGKVADNDSEEIFPASEADVGSKEFGHNTEDIQNDDKIHDDRETTSTIKETAKLFNIKENCPLELTLSTDQAGTSNGQPGVLLTSEIPTSESCLPGKPTVSSNTKIQNEAAWYSNGQEEYNQLLNKYYEIEDQRQRVLQQLNQYSNGYYQYSEQYPASVTQPYSTVTCNCSYGCQSWVIPCNSSPGSCLGHSCTDTNCHGNFKDDQKGNSMPEQDHDFVQTAMVAAKTALSSLKQDTSSNPNTSKNEGKVIGCAEPTDLSVVLNAWYSAGFYTGKYLSEQSVEKKKRG